VSVAAGSLGPEGTRVNAISAGPIRTGFRDQELPQMLAANEKQTMRRNVTDEVGNAGAFLVRPGIGRQR
jgi:enoyl-[acyl-carrier protein] reductase I